jgi:D-sedoheptulose 7-phosphate isomerase
MFNINFENYVRESIHVSEQLSSNCADEVMDAVNRIICVFESGGRMFLCGNGGSAADSQHIAAEFVNGMSDNLQYPLPAVSLTTDTSVITSRANDHSFDTIFSRQIEAIGRPGDVLFGISTSGTSKNVITAMECAKKLGLLTIMLSGFQTNHQFEEFVDLNIRIPSTETQHVQEAMLIVEHFICAEVIKYFMNLGKDVQGV